MELDKDVNIRVMELWKHKVYKVFKQEHDIRSILQRDYIIAEEEDEEIEEGVKLKVGHYSTTYSTWFGQPFFFVFKEGETLEEARERLSDKIQVPLEETKKWKFARVSYQNAKYFKDGKTGVYLCFFCDSDNFR